MIRRLIVPLALVALLLAGCGNAPTTASRKTLAEVTPDVSHADPRLKAIVAQSSHILPGGDPAFQARLNSLRGLPVVVNKWASWCAPCKAEAPVLQQAAKELGGQVAFLGVDMFDGNADAKKFLRKFPLPYPSYSDPNFKISQQFPPVKSAPVTNFYDASGKLVHTQPAQLQSAAEVKELIERYAGPLKTGPSS